ncbi:MAG TPA: LysE family transporter [Acetobacteraceae bacterium]|nr:LysE family transporter [Acetobacteraceae bacterium]
MSYAFTLAGIAAANMLACLSPGPAFLLISRAAAGRSRTIGLATGLGIALAATLWAAAASFGVAAIMTRLATLYGLIQLAGAVYLIWLGLAAWLHPDSGEASLPARGLESRSRAFLVGLSLGLTNPKIVIFFSSIFVALIPAHAPLSLRLAALAVVAADEVVYAGLVACLFSTPRVRALYQRLRHGLERVAGALFIAIGARIAALARL